jgi:hypothetical protein
MSERAREQPKTPPAKDARAERLAAALKANLKRRKAQARGREEAGGDNPPEDPDERG